MTIEMPETFRIEQATITASFKEHKTAIPVSFLEDGSVDFEKLKEDMARIRNELWASFANQYAKAKEDFEAVVNGKF